MRKFIENDGIAKTRQLKASQKSSLHRLFLSRGAKKSSFARVKRDPNYGDKPTTRGEEYGSASGYEAAAGYTHKKRPSILIFYSFVHRKSRELNTYFVTVFGISPAFFLGSISVTISAEYSASARAKFG